MARSAARTRLRSAARRARRSRYARHAPFTAYCLMTAAWVGWTLTALHQATH